MDNFDGISAGTALRVTGNTAHHGFDVGDVVDVIVTTSNNEARVTRRDGEPATWWVNAEDVELFDVTTVTSLDEFKRLAVRALWDAKIANNWCGEAEALARSLGVGDLLPTNKIVEVTVRMTATVWPGEDATTVARAASRSLTLPDGAYVDRSALLDD